MKSKKLLAGILSAAMTASLIQLMPMPASAEVLIHNTFDVNYDGWSNFGEEAELTALASAAFKSARGMRVTNRQSAADGAFSEKGYYIEGGTSYHYSVQVMAETAEHFKLTLTWRYADDTTDSAVIAECDAKAGEWTELACDYEAPDGTCNLTLTLTTDSTNDFCFDTFCVTGQAPTYSESAIKAYAAEAGLKDMYANYFRVGTCMPNGALNNSTITGIVMRDFNSVTCENELKPDATLVQSGSTDSNIKVSLGSAAKIIDFCVNHNIAMRGHTFVWHSQTPSWFFKQGFNNNGNWVDTATMNTRMESYIKNMFAAIETQYPELNLYAYDVCNECIADGNSGGPRQAGDNNQNQGTSAWVSVYHDNSFIKQAFTYAKKYRPEGCKLFYNDYNEYESAKMGGIVKVLKELKAADVIDGMGMQSHITPQYTSSSQYISALKNYASVVGCVHITELDINGGSADYYGDIMQAAMETPEVEAFVVWGTTDGTSWRRGTQCLLFDDNGGKKANYQRLASLVPESQWGDGDNPKGGGGRTPIVYEPDENGCYFFSTFENDEDRWDGRGGASATKTSSESYKGSGALAVSGRTDTWNGTAHNISSNPFKPGETFSFGAAIKYTTGNATEELKMTMQYEGSDGKTHYDKVASVIAKKGEWTKLANPEFQIPEGATGMLLYFETPDDADPKSLIDFYIDNAYGGIKGADPLKDLSSGTEQTTEPPKQTTEPPQDTTVKQPVQQYERGDVDGSGEINVADAVLLARYVAEDKSAKVTEAGVAAADTNKDGKVDANDTARLLERIAGLVKSL